MEIIEGGIHKLTRFYAGGSYMKETTPDSTKEYTWIGGDAYSAPVAAVTQNGTTFYYYVLRDHLGNITHVYDSANGHTLEYSYDAWGRRRNPSDWSYDVSNEPEFFAGRGFTGHEFLKEFNLYNMNGRLYDPLVGRFLSPDILVQSPGYTQSYNRYSYCLNNPLKFTDPSGNILYKRFEDYGDWGGELPRNTGGGGGGGLFYGSGPGQGMNGTGLNGVYYDWFTGEYRSTEEGNAAVGWCYAYGVTNQYGKTYVYDYPQSNLKGSASSALESGMTASLVGIGKVGKVKIKDVTNQFNAQLEKTMIYFTVAKTLFDLKYPEGGLDAEIERLSFFIDKVKSNGQFDIKRTTFSPESLGGLQAIYKGEIFQYDDFGNYNFGVAARYFGYQIKTALVGAGAYQIWSGTSHLNFFNSYFDDPRDSEMINRGYNHVF